MSATITWSVTDMRTVNENYPNIVHLVVVSLKATQNGVEVVSKEPLLLERPTGEFTPYENLTEAQVLQWVFDVFTPQGVAQRENGILENLRDQLTPPVAPVPTPLPWTAE